MILSWVFSYWWQRNMMLKAGNRPLIRYDELCLNLEVRRDIKELHHTHPTVYCAINLKCGHISKRVYTLCGILPEVHSLPELISHDVGQSNLSFWFMSLWGDWLMLFSISHFENMQCQKVSPNVLYCFVYKELKTGIYFAAIPHRFYCLLACSSNQD